MKNIPLPLTVPTSQFQFILSSLAFAFDLIFILPFIEVYQQAETQTGVCSPLALAY